jgi:hypothetical protein
MEWEEWAVCLWDIDQEEEGREDIAYSTPLSINRHADCTVSIRLAIV